MHNSNREEELFNGSFSFTYQFSSYVGWILERCSNAKLTRLGKERGMRGFRERNGE